MNFMSPVEEVNSLHIDPMPTNKPLALVKVVRNGNLVVGVNEKGRVFASIAKPYCYMLGDAERWGTMFNALRYLGVLTKAQVDAHLRAAKDADKRREDRYLADELEKIGKQPGLKLTKAQQAFVDKHSTTARNARIDAARKEEEAKRAAFKPKKVEK